MEEQVIIQMSEYKRLKEIAKNHDKIEIVDKINPWSVMYCDYVGKYDAVYNLSLRLDTALKLIDKIERCGVLGRIFFTGFKKEYNR